MHRPIRIARTLVGTLTLAAALSAPLLALPEGPSVGNGQVNISNPAAGHMTIQQLSDRAIINWNGFSINANELVRFIQPSQLSAILNRVTGQDPSVILGALQANGKVFLINPNGILFGKDATINVGSLFASTLNLTDADFLQERFRLDLPAGQTPAAIVNEGHLEMAPGGFLVLASPLVSNQGVILANTGQVALAAGSRMEVNFDGQGLINFDLKAPSATPGTVAMSSGMVNNLVGNLLNLAPAEDITNVAGGMQLAGAEGRLVNTGAIHADGTPGHDAGRVVLNSTEGTYLANGSVASANGVGANSNGGTVQILSHGLAATQAGSSLQAHAGDTGEGGFIELSGGKGIRLAGQVDAGSDGQFLLDPTNLRIVNIGGQFTPPILFPDGGAVDGTVNASDIAAVAAGTVILQATNSITQDANAPLNMSPGVNLEMTTQTGDITLNGGLTSTGSFTVSAGGNVTTNRNPAQDNPAGFVGPAYNAGTGGITVTAGTAGAGNITTGAGFVSTSTVTLTAANGQIIAPVITNPQNGLPLNSIASIAGAPYIRLSASQGILNSGGGFVPIANAGNVEVVNSGNTNLTIVGPAAASNVTVTGSTGAFSLTGATSIKVNGITAPFVTLQATGDVSPFNAASPGISSNDINITSSGGTIGNAATPLKTSPFSGTNTVLSAQAATGITIQQSTGDITIGATGVNPGTGFASLTATNGNILNTATLGRVTNARLVAHNIGTQLNPVKTAGATVNLNASNVFIDQQGATTLELSGTNAVNSVVNISSNADVTIGNVANFSAPTRTMSIITTGGGIELVPVNPATLQATDLILQASGDIGNVAPIRTSAANLNLTSGAGRIALTNDRPAVLNATAATGIGLQNTGDITIGATGVNGGTFSSLTAVGGNILNTATSGRVTNASLTANSIGTQANQVKTAGATLALRGNNPPTGSNVFIDQQGATSIEINGTNANNSVVNISSNADVTIGNVWSPAQTMSVTTTGSVLNGALFPNATKLVANTLNLSGTTGIGTDSSLHTNAANLNLTSSGGSISLTNDRPATFNATAATGIGLTNSGDLTIGATGVNPGTGRAFLVVGDGNILNTATSGRVTNADLIANNIGTQVNSVKTTGATLNLSVGTITVPGGNIFIDQQGPTTITQLNNTSAINSVVNISSNADVTIGNAFSPAQTMSVTTTGAILNGIAVSPAPAILANTVNLSGQTGIGSSTAPMRTAATNLNLTSSAGSVDVQELDGASLNGQAGQDFNVKAGGALQVGQVQAGGNVNLDAQGAITGTGTGPNVKATSATLTSADTVGSGNLPLLTQVQSLQATGTNGVFVNQTGSLSASATSSNGPIHLEVDGGTLTLGLLAAATTIDVEVCGGSILDGNGNGRNIQSGGSTRLSASGIIGTQADPIDVEVLSDAMFVAAGSQVDATSIVIQGNVPNDRLEVFTPDPGSTCFSISPPGAVILNGIPAHTPASDRGQQAVVTPLIQMFPPGPFLDLDARQRVMSSSFVPFYTLSLAFLMDKDEWLKFLNKTVVWESDPEESKDL